MVRSRTVKPAHRKFAPQLMYSSTTDMLTFIHRYLHERGNSADAIFFNNMAQSICESFKLRILEEPESAFGTSVTLAGLNYSLAEILHNRGCIALEINEPSDALYYHRLFNDRMVKQLSGEAGEKDMRLAISWNELGNAYMLNDNWVTGEDCFLKSIEEMRRLRDYNKTTISLPLANLGLSYWLQNKLETAARVLVQGLEERADELGEDDKVSFISGRILHAIGNVRGSQGRRDEAYKFHRRLLLQYKATLGNRHHRTADAFSKVGEHQILRGQHETALALLDAAQSAYSLSNNFEPEKMRAIWFRVKALNALGRTKEAEAELAKCFQIYSRLMASREGEEDLAKRKGNELTNHDIDRLIAFWSR
jgi:tetratricopeptide (TPR) repeat protein